MKIEKDVTEIANEILSQGNVDISDPRLKVTNKDGNSVAHAMVVAGYIFPEDSPILLFADDKGWSVAHAMAFKGHHFSDDLPLLTLADNDQFTVAHAMALEGYCFPEDSPVLKLSDKDQYTVAHTMAANGYRITRKDILELTDNQGNSVLEIQAQYNDKAIYKE